MTQLAKCVVGPRDQALQVVAIGELGEAGGDGAPARRGAELSADLVLERNEAATAASCPGQRVGGCPLAVASRLRAVARRLPPMACGLLAIACRPPAITCRLFAVGGRALAVESRLRADGYDLGRLTQEGRLHAAIVSLRVAISCVGDAVAEMRGLIPSAGGGIAVPGGPFAANGLVAGLRPTVGETSLTVWRPVQRHVDPRVPASTAFGTFERASIYHHALAPREGLTPLFAGKSVETQARGRAPAHC